MVKKTTPVNKIIRIVPLIRADVHPMNQFQSRNTVKSGSNLYRKYNNKSYSFDITNQQLKNLQIGYNFKKKKGKRSSETQGFKHLDGTSSKNMDSLLRLTQMNDLDLLGNILQTGQYIEDMKSLESATLNTDRSLL